ncbi:hypothetical protein HYH03_007191 [Edaphochlamys debaryana]|uniref:Uncharacterized protein n=1 Tax=Edaphochlamys debaryana TaxID=47281 RepID=A0A835Y947_9CHLO|nr:hypothetical protein HYH03_007191 [Edaphochlamys debaryana]|eukprot:KAG2494675.1 hypothetical protein HYH03_007191 [Edaphochlamys debaryana]
MFVQAGPWTSEIQDLIAGCEVFIPLCSAEYGKSDHTYRELQHADFCRRSLLSVWHSGPYPPKGLEHFLPDTCQRVPPHSEFAPVVDFEAMIGQILGCLINLGCLPRKPSTLPPPPPRPSLALMLEGATPVQPLNLKAVRPARTNAERSLIQAAMQGELGDVVRLLGDPNDPMNPNVTNQEGWTALHCACRFGHTGVVEALLQAEAEASVQRGDGDTPLHIAIDQCQRPVVEALLRGGADMSIRNKHGFTPLIAAVVAGNLEAVEALLRAGADVGERTSVRTLHIPVGLTPLHLAASLGRREVAEALLAAGADREAIDEEGSTPAQLARSKGQAEIAMLVDKWEAAPPAA